MFFVFIFFVKDKNWGSFLLEMMVISVGWGSPTTGAVEKTYGENLGGFFGDFFEAKKGDSGMFFFKAVKYIHANIQGMQRGFQKKGYDSYEDGI